MTDVTERRQALLDIVRDVCVDHLRLTFERDQIQPDTPLFGTGLGMDSIDAVDLIVGVEARTKIRVPDNWRGRLGLRTVNGLITLLVHLEEHDLSTEDVSETGVDPATPMQALRLGVAWARMDHVQAVILRGENAFDQLDAILPRPVFVRKGQILPALLLDGEGRPVADLEICCLGEDYLILVEGLDAEALIARIAEEAGPIDAEVVSDAILGVHGPHAWEVVADLFGDGVIGMPYLSSFDLDSWKGRGLRSGKTGEYGYLLMVAPERAEAALAELLAAAEPYGAMEIGLAELDLAALENGFFSMRHHQQMPTARELQLLWRTSWDREFRGLDAMADKRESQSRRVTWMRLAGDPVDAGTPVTLNGTEIGHIQISASSETLGGTIGLGLLDPEFAWPGLELDGAETLAPPLLNNRSLHIDTQRHAWLARHTDRFPPLRPEWP